MKNGDHCKFSNNLSRRVNNMNNEKKVVFPTSVLEEMQIEGTIFPKVVSDLGIAMLSHQDGPAHVLRIYQLLYNSVDDIYEPVQELASFSLPTKNDLLSFIDNIPHLNGIEMLLLLNPLNQQPDFLN